MLKRMLQSHTVKYRGPRDNVRAVKHNDEERLKNNTRDGWKSSGKDVRTCQKREKETSSSNGCCSVVVTDSVAESVVVDGNIKGSNTSNNKRKMNVDANECTASMYEGNYKENTRGSRKDKGHRTEQESAQRRTKKNDAPVFVLGGNPRKRVPRNASRFDAGAYKTRRRFVPSVHDGNPGFNHYDDGAGFMDGEETFGEDAEGLSCYQGGGFSWEGMGTIGYRH
eukprot:jgi/Picsp_1/6626/NSC_03969-R1_---NA---